MDNSTLEITLFFGLFGLLIWVAILKWIIESSTLTKERYAIEKAELKLLIQIAMKLQVSQEAIEKAATIKPLIKDTMDTLRMNKKIK